MRVYICVYMRDNMRARYVFLWRISERGVLSCFFVIHVGHFFLFFLTPALFSDWQKGLILKKELETKEEGSIPPRTPLVIIIIRRKYMRVVGTRRGYDESIIIVVLIIIMIFSFFLFERTRGPGGDNFRHHSLSVGFRKTFLQDTRRAFD